MVKKCSDRRNAIDEVFRNKTQGLDGIIATSEYRDSIFYSVEKISRIKNNNIGILCSYPVDKSRTGRNGKPITTGGRVYKGLNLTLPPPLSLPQPRTVAEIQAFFC